MAFPLRRDHFAKSNDPRLSSILATTNICCGTLKDCTKEQKNAFFACLEGYNKLYGKELSPERKEWSDLLFSTVKFLGSTNSVEKKEEFLKKRTDRLLEILQKLGA